jgi:hypothetical protein
VGGRRFRAWIDLDTGSMRAQALLGAGTEREEWAEVAVLRAYWFAWAAFHPGTRIHDPTPPAEAGR